MLDFKYFELRRETISKLYAQLNMHFIIMKNDNSDQTCKWIWVEP